MGARRLKSYTAVVVDAEGVAYEYISFARNRRNAKKEVRASAAHWGATVVAIRRVASPRRGRRRRELVVAGITIGVSAITVTAMMIFGLSLEGVL